jgi:hypothetical protein
MKRGTLMEERGSRNGFPSAWLWSIVALAGALNALVVWMPRYLPLVDLPNHMARHCLESKWLQDAMVGDGYRVDYRLLPNLGGDLVIPLLLRACSAQVASKIFVLAALMLYWVGAAVYIRRVAGKSQASFAASLLLLPFVIDGSVYWGFLNFFSGLGLAFLALAHQDWLIRGRSIRPLGWILHAGLVALLFVWHLADWGIYIALGGCRLVHGRLSRFREDEGQAPRPESLHRILAMSAAVLPSFALWAAYTAHRVNASAVAPNASLGEVVASLPWKLRALPWVFHSFSVRADLIVIITWGAALAAWFAPIRLASPKRMTVPLLGLILSLILYLCIPHSLGTTNAADLRVLPAILVCSLAVLAGAPIRRIRTGSILLIISIIIKYNIILNNWVESGRRLDHYSRAFDHLTAGCRLLPINVRGIPRRDRVEHHFHCWAVVERGAYDPDLFAMPGQQVIRRTSARRLPSALDAAGLNPAELEDDFDYIWVMNPEGERFAMPAGCDLVFNQDALTLWRIRRGTRRAGGSETDRSPDGEVFYERN